MTLSSSISPSLNRIALFNIEFQEAKLAYSRMREFSEIKREITDGQSISTLQKIEIRGLSFHFPGSLPLLKNVNLKIETGKITTLLGESGAGKSTILQLIQRFYIPNSGLILANNINIQSLQLENYRKQIGVVSQHIKIFNNYLLFNITLSKEPHALRRVTKWCEENGLDQFFTEFPQGYMTLLGEEGVNISGGQKQLVGLARALYRQPKILLIDEGTTALDTKKEEFILGTIQKIKSKMAILMVTHRRNIAQISDHTYILENGETTL